MQLVQSNDGTLCLDAVSLFYPPYIAYLPLVRVDIWDMALPYDADSADKSLVLHKSKALDERVARSGAGNDSGSPVYLLVMGLAMLNPLLVRISRFSPFSVGMLLGRIAKKRGRISGTQASATATLGSTPLNMMTGNIA